MLFDSRRLGNFLYAEVIVQDIYRFRPFVAARTTMDVLDIGANNGMFSVMASVLCPGARKVAVEPHPETYARLVQNVAFLGVRPFQVALGNGSPVDFCARKNSGNMQTTPGSQVPSMKLGDLIRHTGITISRNTFIKMDCEGAESCLLGDPEVLDILSRIGGFSAEVHFRGRKFPQAWTREEFDSFFLDMTKAMGKVTLAANGGHAGNVWGLNDA
jgi:FkbM family methyltransferase